MENQGFNPNPSGGMYPPGGYPPPPQGRPVILTVFGILTFVACGFGLLGALGGLVGIGSGGGSFGAQIEQPAYMHLLALVIIGLKVFGVIQMFQLKRVGFFAYTGAELFSYVIFLLNWETMEFQMAMTSLQTGMDVSMLVMGSLIFSLILSAVWIGVYASQLRHMK